MAADPSLAVRNKDGVLQGQALEDAVQEALSLERIMRGEKPEQELRGSDATDYFTLQYKKDIKK